MPTTHTSRTNFNGDGFTDLLWVNGPTQTWVTWAMDGSGRFITGAEILPNDTRQWSVMSVGDFLGNGTSGMVLQNNLGDIALWHFADGRPGPLTALVNQAQSAPVAATGDFNGDGLDDILLHAGPSAANPDGLWTAVDASDRRIPNFGMGNLERISIDFSMRGVGDFNGDGKDDLLFRGMGNATVGTYLIELLNTQPNDTRAEMQSERRTFRDPQNGWDVARIADFDGDKKADILWQHEGGLPGIWLMDGGNVRTMVALPNPGKAWAIADAEDYNNDGKADILWRHQDGTVGEWIMDGTRLVSAYITVPSTGSDWNPVGF